MDNSGIIALAVALEAKWGATILPAKRNRVPDGCLESLLKEVLYHIQPLDEDRRQRLDIISRFTLVLQSLEHLKGASVVPFGSFISDLYTRWGDLDISIEMPLDRQNASPVGKKKKIKTLKELRQALLRKGAAQNIELIPHARVPLLSFEDPYFKISCDVSIDNGSGLLKSRLLNLISQIDTRCRDLIFLVKYWAKAHNINDPKLGTLNSFSLTLLVIFHLQTRSPPIIPPFKSIYNGDIVHDLAEAKGRKEMLGMQIEARCIKFHGFGEDNRSSISDLFISFFAQYASVEDLWAQGLTICPFTGKWGDVSISGSHIKKQYPMIIEDPFDHVENCARSVNESTLKTISDAFLITAQALQRPSVDMHSLRYSLFGCLQGKTKVNIKPSHANSVETSRNLENNTNKGGSSQVYEKRYVGTTFRGDQRKSVDSFSTSRKLEDSPKKGEFSQVYERVFIPTVEPKVNKRVFIPTVEPKVNERVFIPTVEPKVNKRVFIPTVEPKVNERVFIPTVFTSEDFLPATSSHGCSLDERSTSVEPEVNETVFIPTVFTSEDFLPATFSHGCSLDERSTSGSKQPGSITRHHMPYDHLKSQDHRVWKPKNGYMGF